MAKAYHGSDDFPRRALKNAIKQTLVLFSFITAFAFFATLLAERYFPEQQGYAGMIGVVLAYLAWKPIADDIARANRIPK